MWRGGGNGLAEGKQLDMEEKQIDEYFSFFCRCQIEQEKKQTKQMKKKTF